MPSRALRLTPLIAAILAVVFNTVGAFTLSGSGPGEKASGAEVIAYFGHHQTNNQRFSLFVAATLLCFLVFAGFLRRALCRDGRVEYLATLSLAGAVLFAAGFAASASLDATLSDSAGSLQPAAAQALNALNNGPIFAANVGGCVFAVAIGAALIAGRALPRGFGWIAVLFGLGCLTPLAEEAYNLILLWALAAAIALYRSERPTVTESPSKAW
jgi:hypothetical protein